MPYTVLIADDNDDLREEVAWLLRSEGYRVLTAADGVYAMERLNAVRVDALLLDWNMPRLGGSGVLAAVSPDPRFAHLAVIVATAEPERVPAGVPIIAKPFAVDHLVDTLRAALQPASERARTGEREPSRLTAAR
jgi:CheY-like chemotaxis protein